MGLKIELDYHKWENMTNFAADLVRGGSKKHVQDVHRLAEKPVYY